jgi:DNA recombination-dependent growth factor C
MKMTWNDQITFVLKNDFTFQSLQYQDSVVELTGEGKNDEEESSFKTDFFIMGGILTKMFQEFLKIFAKTGDKKA